MTTAGILAADERFDAVFDILRQSGMECRRIARGETADVDLLVLPLPLSDDTAPALEPLFRAHRGKRAFGGKCGAAVRELAEKYDVFLTDYCEYEPFAVRNAVPTAEGALEIAMRETKRTLCGAKVMVCGFGRIGKILSNRLRALGSEVTVSTTDPANEAWCGALGYRCVSHRDLVRTAMEQDIVFSTAPARIFDRAALEKCRRETLFVDLSGRPGSIDAAAPGFRVVQAFGLPGRVAPRAAGEIIAKCIIKLWKEDAYGTG